MSEEAKDDFETLQAELEAKQEKIAALSRESAKWRRIAQGKDSAVPEDYDELKGKVEEYESKLKKAETSYKQQIDKLSASLAEKDNALQSYLLDGGLSDALAKAGVAAPYMDAAKALLRQQAKIAQEDGKYQALMGDKPILEAVKEWASSEVGKHFVSAPKNSGGGAPGSSSGTATKSFKDMSSEERTALYRNDPARYEQLKQAS